MKIKMNDEFSRAQRHAALLNLGGKSVVADEVIERSACERWWSSGNAEFKTSPSFPLFDEAHIDAWRSYHVESQTKGVLQTLKNKLLQFAFPVRSGISQEAGYRNATLKGIEPSESGKGLHFDDPDGLTLELHSTRAGTIPVLAVHSRSDFETLVQALTARNEPIAISPAMGACLVNGLNNWDRIRTLRSRWEKEDASHKSPEAWTAKFRQIIPQKELYKDKLIILSRGSYSGVQAEEVGLSDEDWNQLSFRIRMEHECTHALSLRIFGALRHDLLEELVADWVGLIKVFGEYKADLALRFLGLEDFPSLRKDGRLHVYRGNPPLSDPAFDLMQRLAWQCILHLDQISSQRPDLLESDDSLARLTLALSTMPAEAVASFDGVDRILARLNTL